MTRAPEVLAQPSTAAGQGDHPRTLLGSREESAQIRGRVRARMTQISTRMMSENVMRARKTLQVSVFGRWAGFLGIEDDHE